LDLPILKLEIGELSLPELNLDCHHRLDTAEIDRMLISAPTDKVDADDAVPNSMFAPQSRLHDLWLLDRHKVYCGSALDSNS